MLIPLIVPAVLCTASESGAIDEAAGAGAAGAGAAAAEAVSASAVGTASAKAIDAVSGVFEPMKEIQELFTGPSVSSRVLERTTTLDFRVSHPLAANFDAWFASQFGEAHPYSREFPLMTPHAVLAIALGYLFIVIVGAFIVRSAGGGVRMKPVMRAYNLFMVILSAYMGTKSIMLARESNSSVFCVPLARSAAGVEMARLTWLFTFSKVVEFLDTVFMIAEGRLRQVSFLHVYHHVTILSYWFTITWMMPGSDAYFSLAGNSYIHVAMYGYYLLASFGYSPWWKYYITKAQIAQFCLFCVQSIYVGYIMTDKRCDFPNMLSRGLLWYMLTLIVLFVHFLVTNKRRKESVKLSKKTQ